MWNLCTGRDGFYLQTIVEYFENLYLGIIDAVYELKGVEISIDVTESRYCETTPKACVLINTDNLNRSELISDNSLESNTLFCSCRGCCFVCLNAICFSILKEISYWNENTLDAIVE